MPTGTAVDLFAGAGGATQGLKEAGFWVVAAVEYDPFAADTYRTNHPTVHLVEDDISRVDADQLRGAARRGPQPTLCDEVVCLGPFRLEDAIVMVRWDADPEMQRWLDFPTELPEGFDHLAHCEDVIRQWWALWVTGTAAAFMVRDARSEVPLGSCELPSHPGGRGRHLVLDDRRPSAPRRGHAGCRAVLQVGLR